MFAAGTADEVWLPEVGALGHLVLSKDDAMRLNEGQKAILMAANVRAFFLGCADASGSVMASAFLEAAPRMVRLAKTEPRAFIARVHSDVRVTFIERAPRKMRARK